MAKGADSEKASVTEIPTTPLDHGLTGFGNVATSVTSEPIPEHAIVYLKGIRFVLIVISMYIAVFLTNVEIPIITTSLVGITDDLGSYDRASWITSSYLLAYVGVMIIVSKLSDIFGRKPVFLISLGIFLVFSAACSAAQTLTQLIILRAFQGIGGSGCFALSAILTLELVPESQYATMVTLFATAYSVAYLAGPLIGGAITKDTTWRWVFIFNVPLATTALIIAYICIPEGFPYHGAQPVPEDGWFTLMRKSAKRLDLLGVVLLLLATLSLVTAFEEAGMSFGWDSAFVITLLVVSVFLWIGFILWERFVTRRSTLPGKTVEPVFPWRFALDRRVIGMLLNSVFLGASFIGAMFQLPQVFQAVHGTSPMGAAVRTIAYTFTSSIGAIIASVLAKRGIPPIYIVIVGSMFQATGFALLGTKANENVLRNEQYAYQAIAALGTGATSTLVTLMTPFLVESRDKAVAMGSNTQFRIMGGAIGVSIGNAATQTYIQPRLRSLLPLRGVEKVLASARAVQTLEPELRNAVQLVLAGGYALQMKIFAGLAALQVLGALLMWQEKQIRV